MYDYLIIRHRTFTPPNGLVLDAIPADFAGFGKPDYYDKYDKELEKALPFPHLKSVPHRDEIKDFHEWVMERGKPWLLDGNVIYAPFLVSSDIEMEVYVLIQTKLEFSKVSLSSIIIRIMEETDERKTQEIYVIPEGSNNERAT